MKKKNDEEVNWENKKILTGRRRRRREMTKVGEEIIFVLKNEGGGR